MGLEIRKIGVIGAGQMGKGIAHVCAISGYDVALNDVTEERIDAGLKDIASQLQKSVDRGFLDAAARDHAVARIAAAPTAKNFRDFDLMIEAASENEDVKRKILTDFTPFLKQDAIIGSNTSSISITRLAAISGRPERFIGIHFMNPVPRCSSSRSSGASRRTTDLRGDEGLRHQARQDDHRRRGFSGLHRQSHSAADDQRGDLHAL